MKKRSIKKLVLAKETLRRLTEAETSSAVGGTVYYSICSCDDNSAMVDCPDMPGTKNFC